VTTVLSRCSWASCRSEATQRAGEWPFCDFHAEQDRAMQAGEHLRDGDPPCAPCQAAATRAAADRVGGRMTTPTMTTGSTIGTLLEQASGHGDGKVSRLAAKIEANLDDLRALMAASVEQEKARREVERLEEQLREAKARLRGGRSAPTTSAAKGWTPEARAAAAERMRQRNLAKAQERQSA
jgi:hypothetical protein